MQGGGCLWQHRALVPAKRVLLTLRSIAHCCQKSEHYCNLFCACIGCLKQLFSKEAFAVEGLADKVLLGKEPGKLSFPFPCGIDWFKLQLQRPGAFKAIDFFFRFAVPEARWVNPLSELFAWRLINSKLFRQALRVLMVSSQRTGFPTQVCSGFASI